MNRAAHEPLLDPELRVLLRTASSKDALLTTDVMARSGIAVHACADMRGLVGELDHGAGALMVAEELLSDADIATLEAALSAQPPWSDIPVLLLARQGADSRALARIMERLPVVTVIERPVRVASLVSAVGATLRARRRQYELRARLADLHEADQRKTEFLATLAHELRNPLAPMSTALALLSRPETDAATAARHHEVMRRQVDHMVRLVDDLMEVSRITRGKVDLQRVPVQLDSAVNDAIELSRPFLAAAGLALTVERSAERLVVRADAVRLAQVFSNLLNNAAKYTPQGGGRVTLAMRREGAAAVVEVRDEGIGIPPEMLNVVFDMFVQVSGTSKAAQGGLGIGLTLVKTLVELHGGTVSAASAGLDKGSTFTVRLPLDTAVQDHVSVEPVADDWQTRLVGWDILVIDDNRDAADSLSELLGMMGASVRTAYSGPEAMHLAEAKTADAAVVDIGMPGMDGCELARHLRALPGGGEMLLIALTGWGQDRDKDLLAAAGFNHHLLKPVEPELLTRLLVGVGIKPHGGARDTG